MTSVHSYFIPVEEPTQEIDMLVCDFDGFYYEWFLMVKVSEVDEEPRYVYKFNLNNYYQLLKTIAI